jgi:hypothetical protein
MEAFPDLQVSIDHVSGIEVWKIGALGLVADSTGYYDAATDRGRH